MIIGYSSVLGIKWVMSEPMVVKGDFSLHREVSSKKVLFYGTDWCPICEKTRTYFKARKVDYDELNPEKDEQVMTNYLLTESKGYPVIIIGNTMIYGFNVDEVESALKENGLI